MSEEEAEARQPKAEKETKAKGEEEQSKRLSESKAAVDEEEKSSAGARAEETDDAQAEAKDKGKEADEEKNTEKAEKDGEISQDIHHSSGDRVQKITDDTIAEIDMLLEEKEAEIRYQLRSTEEIIKKTTGMSMKPLFRPPYGARDARVLRIAADEGYRSIYWTVDSLDWKTDTKPEQVKNRVLAGIGNGAIGFDG